MQSREVLASLAGGTGGFVIRNTNDLTEGLRKIGNEQREYYLISYTPADSKDGCHALKVKVSRGGTDVRARNGYCVTKPLNILAGTPAERDLESKIVMPQPAASATGASLQTPYLYTAPNTASVKLAMELPSAGIRFEKVKGKLHAEVSILALAYRGEEVAARFSDKVNLDFDGQSDVDAFAKKPLHYDNQFEIGPGNYSLKVAYGQAGGTSGTVIAPLVVDAYDGKGLSVSALALCRETRPARESDPSIQLALMEGRAPLYARNTLYIPAGEARFGQGEPVRVYVELYDPELLGGTADVKVRLSVKNKATGAAIGGGDLGSVVQFARAGTNVIPIGFTVNTPVAGTYRVEVQATGTTGAITRATEFDVR